MTDLKLKAKSLSYIIDGEPLGGKGQRADKVLSGLEGLPSRSQLKQWFEKGCIRRGAEILDASSMIRPGDKIDILPPVEEPLNLTPKKMDLKIYFEDENLIVLYKPKGLVMHPGSGTSSEPTLVHGLLAHSQELSEVGDEMRPGIVHRLDKNTEGIVVVAKNNSIHEALSSQFETRTIDRAYWALCWGKFPKSMIIDEPIGRNPRDRKKMGVIHSGKESVTEVKLVKAFEEGYSWVECKLRTGRTHQIRVHMAHKKFSLLGDEEYSKRRKVEWSAEKEAAYQSLNGQALVAFRLGFLHPKTQERLSFEAPMPEWLKVFSKE